MAALARYPDPATRPPSQSFRTSERARPLKSARELLLPPAQGRKNPSASAIRARALKIRPPPLAMP
ncbi:hypothetical protein BC826DRAFT_1032429 [Russula brevipes]|nr:hypothetical protein BC826DRAFT_1032429 [Russula brevipes]